MTEPVKNIAASIQARLKNEAERQGRPFALTAEFGTINQARWSNFLKKMNLETNESNDFVNIIERIWTFLQIPLLASINRTKSNYHWTPRKGWK